MKYVFAAMCAAAILTAPVMAQDRSQLPRDYTILPAVQQMIDDMFSADAMMSNFAAGLPAGFSMTAEQSERIGTILSNGMGPLRPKMVEVMVETSAAWFTTEELEALIAFYSTDVGSSILRKNQGFFAQAMSQMAPDLQEMQRAVGPDILKVLQATQ